MGHNPWEIRHKNITLIHKRMNFHKKRKATPWGIAFL